jgi:hypothetical protein
VRRQGSIGATHPLGVTSWRSRGMCRRFLKLCRFVATGAGGRWMAPFLSFCLDGGSGTDAHDVDALDQVFSCESVLS